MPYNIITNQSTDTYSKKNLQSAVHSPNVDSDNDFDSGRESDADRSTPSSAEQPRKKKRRITFSPIEVCELEKAFAQRPYLMPEDEDELVQKLGLTIRNIRVRIINIFSFQMVLYVVFAFSTFKKIVVKNCNM